MTTTDAQPNAAIQVAIVDGPVDRLAAEWPGTCGAEVVFFGRTREETHEKFGRLQFLSYEVFEPMAVKLLEKMCQEAAKDHDCRAIRLLHSKGRVNPGQASVVIEVATPHRSEAFVACRFLIDRLKHELPVWKTEVWERGQTRVKGCCAHHPDDREVIAESQ